MKNIKNKSKKKVFFHNNYEGDKSVKFWKTINSLKNEEDKNELYSLGVLLQNTENFVLKRLNDVLNK